MTEKANESTKKADVSNLLNELKAFLDITWSDEATELKLNGMLHRSIFRLKELVDTKLDFESDETAKELLFNRVMYDRSGALDDFEKNYLSTIVFMQNKYKVSRYYDAQEQT